MQINNGDTYTTSATVTLTLNASDAVSGIAQVRYSNDGVWDTEAWETLAANKTWMLPTGDGTKTVYCAIKNNAGLPTVVSGTITLDTVAPTGSIIINGGANYTNTQAANVTLSVSDTNVVMRFSNDNTTWTEWQTYASSAAWTLPTPDGTKTIYVQFKDNAGLISTFTLRTNNT